MGKSSLFIEKDKTEKKLSSLMPPKNIKRGKRKLSKKKPQ